MLGGLNSGAIGMRPPPFIYYDSNLTITGCKCYPTARPSLRYVARDTIIAIYTHGDATFVLADPADLVAPETGAETSPADVRLSPFVYKGDVYLQIEGGRIGRRITATFTIDDGVEVEINLELVE